ncbi:hypothetical protein BGZ83_002864 [Gryganskiella cystojenkinii]|nr:hypothetical protein BGZ83_002864 [Gryganskiella cystojenkinii]
MSKDIERATLKKAVVNTLPLWATPEPDRQTPSRLDGLAEEDDNLSSRDPSYKTHVRKGGINGSGSYSSNGGPPVPAKEPSVTSPSSSVHIPRYSTSSTASVPAGGGKTGGVKANAAQVNTNSINLPPTSTGGTGQSQDWSVFVTMSNVSTVSSLGRKYKQSLGQVSTSSLSEQPLLSPSSTSIDTISAPPAALTSPGGNSSNAMSSIRRIPQRLDEMFKQKSAQAGTTTATSNICTCTCSEHQYSTASPSTRRGGQLHLSASSKRQKRKEESMDMGRGYPTGQCTSTEPPVETTWDEKESEEDEPFHLKNKTAKNTAFNLDALKMFLNSPLFSNFLKSLTIMASVSLFAIALDAIIILLKTPDQQTQLSNDNAALIVTVVLSILTIAYSCFTIFLESRRPPEGLDTSNSKPLIVIFSEIIASIVWAQVLSVTIYIYIWTYGCTEAGADQISRLWKQELADRRLTERLCRRQGSMVGLELLLVVLLIFNFYTHLAQNFKFIRAVS